MSGAGYALTVATLALFLGVASAAGEPHIDFVGRKVWRMNDADFGGFSGLELSPDGASYWALSDRGTIRWGSIERDAQGRIAELTMAGQTRLRDQQGEPLPPNFIGDAEGLAIDNAGRLFVSFEGKNRISRYDTPDASAVRLPDGEWFKKLRPNGGMEALAITPSGDLLTVPEEPIGPRDRAEVMRLSNGTWSQAFSITRDPDWKPTGADIGPDGRLYLLERAFKGLRGFSSRVRRFDIVAGKTPVAGETLLETAPRQYDNLESIAVWNYGTGLRLTMISDDNFFFVQQTELVEYRLTE